MSESPTDLANEPQRLAVLRGTGLLDTAPAPSFDDLVRLACRICDAPTALVSLVEADRQWFKARLGFAAPQTDIGSSVCAHALAEPDLLIIPDLTVDPRTAANPLVTGEPGIRFYAGAPIRLADGHALGTLCVIDTKPRPGGLTADQADGLRILGRQVSEMISAHRAVHRQQADFAERDAVRFQLAQTTRKLQLATEATQLGIFDYDLISGELHWDDRLRQLFGVPEGTTVTYEGSFLAGLHPDDRAGADAAVNAALDPGGPGLFDIEYRVQPLDGGPLRWLAARGQAVVEEGRTVRFIGSVRDITARRGAEIALAATEERYRSAAQATNDAIWDWNLQSNHVLWNAALTSAYGHDLSEVEPTGDWWIGHIHPEDRDRIDRSIHAVIDGSETNWSDEYRFLRADGCYADIHDRGSVIRDDQGRAVRMIGAMLDVTARKASVRRQAALVEIGDLLRKATTLLEMTEGATAIVGKILDASRAGFGRMVDDDSIEIEPHWSDDGSSIAGRHRFADYGDLLNELLVGEPLVIDDVGTDPRTIGQIEAMRALDIGALVNVPVMDRGRPVVVLIVQDRDPRHWTADELAFIRNVADRIQTEMGRLEAQDRQRILNEELSHRLKNTLAVVSGIAAQTLRRNIDPELFSAFEQRLFALGRAHEILMKQSWTAAPLSEIVLDVTGRHGDPWRFTVSGPPITLEAKTALSLALVLHELATNAVKYGALSLPGGTVAVEWEVEGVGPEAVLAFDWAERGGPPVVAPTGKGFGSKLLRTGFGTGTSELRYEPSGLSAQFRALLSSVAVS